MYVYKGSHIHTHIHLQLLIKPDLLPCVVDIAWDWINNKLYWTDFVEQEIEVYDFTNGYRRVLLYTGNTSAPIGIVVDPQNR